ncbi:hypothetical protein FACS1894110_21410 [Spirochaetia bacterium]|nr:hypothetical protein FACS1894110_21410 [Spirochaetia bacterium]
MRNKGKGWAAFSDREDLRDKAGGEGKYTHSPQSFKQILSDFYLQTDGTMFPNAVMVKMGKDEAFRKNGGKSQKRRQNDKGKPQAAARKLFLKKSDHVCTIY